MVWYLSGTFGLATIGCILFLDEANKDVHVSEVKLALPNYMGLYVGTKSNVKLLMLMNILKISLFSNLEDSYVSEHRRIKIFYG